VSDWHWEPHPDDLLDILPPEARTELDQLAREIVVRDSMVYLDGRDYVGPGLQIETRMREDAEVRRAWRAMQRCIAEAPARRCARPPAER
jgi:hypothetical protein